MKVLLLTAWYTPHAIGGAERVVRTIAAGLVSMGHEPIVVTTRFDGDSEHREVDGVRVRCVPVRNLYDFSPGGAAAWKKPLWHAVDSYNPLMRGPLERVIRDERPDVVHTHIITGFSPSSWDAAARCGVPIVHTLHDYYVICARSAMAIKGVWCRQRHTECVLLSGPRRRLARHVDAVVGVSDHVLARHQQEGVFAQTRSEVISNPCHLVGTRPRDRSGRGSSFPLRFGFMARLEANKGIELLLEAVRRIPSGGWTLTVAGKGPPGLESVLRSTYENDRVSFVGSVDPAEFLADIDVLVVPSLFPETFGMSAAEALAMGVPVVASTRGALPELIENGRNGFTFDPDDRDALPRILTRLLGDRAWIAGARTACVESVQRLSPASVVARYAQLYTSVLR